MSKPLSEPREKRRYNNSISTFVKAMDFNPRALRRLYTFTPWHGQPWHVHLAAVNMCVMLEGDPHGLPWGEHAQLIYRFRCDTAILARAVMIVVDLYTKPDEHWVPRDGEQAAIIRAASVAGSVHATLWGDDLRTALWATLELLCEVAALWHELDDYRGWGPRADAIRDVYKAYDLADLTFFDLSGKEPAL